VNGTRAVRGTHFLKERHFSLAFARALCRAMLFADSSPSDMRSRIEARRAPGAWRAILRGGHGPLGAWMARLQELRHLNVGYHDGVVPLQGAGKADRETVFTCWQVRGESEAGATQSTGCSDAQLLCELRETTSKNCERCETKQRLRASGEGAQTTSLRSGTSQRVAHLHPYSTHRCSSVPQESRCRLCRPRLSAPCPSPALCVEHYTKGSSRHSPGRFDAGLLRRRPESLQRCPQWPAPSPAASRCTGAGQTREGRQCLRL